MTLLLRKRIVSFAKLNPNRPQTLLFSSSANVSVPTADFLTTQPLISPETSLKAPSAISRIKNPQNTNTILSCLKQTGFSLPQIDLMINKFPRILNISPMVLKEKLGVFQSKGLSTPDTIHIISNNPEILYRSSEKRLEPSIDALKASLGSNDAVCRVLKKLSWFLDRDMSKTMIPNVELLKKHFELSSSQVAECVMRSPMLFCLKTQTVEDGAKRLNEMGLKWSSKMYLHALSVVSSLSDEKLKLRMSFFRGLGLSENEVLRIFTRCPTVLGCSEKNIKDKIEVLLSWGADPSLLRTSLELLTHSLEKRIKPRLEVIKVLEEKGLLPKKPSLTLILHVSNKKFMERFVLPNSNALGDEGVVGITKILALHSAV